MKICLNVCQNNLPEKSDRNTARKKTQNICQKTCQKLCSENLPEDLQNFFEICPKIAQKISFDLTWAIWEAWNFTIILAFFAVNVVNDAHQIVASFWVWHQGSLGQDRPERLGQAAQAGGVRIPTGNPEKWWHSIVPQSSLPCPCLVLLYNWWRRFVEIREIGMNDALLLLEQALLKVLYPKYYFKMLMLWHTTWVSCDLAYFDAKNKLYF